MSDHESIGDISDLSNVSDGEIVMTRSPPSRGHLEKESSKLRSKFKILRQALIEEKLAEVNKRIEAIEKDANPSVAQELSRLEAKRTERTLSAHERKRVKVETIINEYKCKVQGTADERRAIELETIGHVQASPQKSKRTKSSSRKVTKRSKKAKAPEGEPAEDLAVIKERISPLNNSDFEYDSRELIHSE